MNTDTIHFLTNLLWVNEDDDGDLRTDGDPTIHKFTHEFVDGVDNFIDGFREYLVKRGFDTDRLSYLERTFGGNVFFSLTGHGVGFSDEYGDPEKTLGKELQAHIEAYSGNRYRFDELEHNLTWTDDGQIDLAVITEFLNEHRARLFSDMGEGA